MLKYLIIQLDDTSTSFCHYNTSHDNPNLMPLDILKKAIRWSMVENLNVQFIYPEYTLPEEYNEAIEKINHTKIKPATYEHLSEGDIAVFNSIAETQGFDFTNGANYVIRTCKDELFKSFNDLRAILETSGRLSLVISDIQKFDKNDFSIYKSILERLAEVIRTEYVDKRHPIQFNLLTDRMMLISMNNCGAGDECITLAPNGRFYICPAFYYDNPEDNAGDIENGPDVKNQQLLKLDHAPICRHCDAFQCHRCVWLNRLTTLEVNTPSHEQCVVAHLERNASRQLLADIRETGEFIPDKDIPEIDYIDPFDLVKNKL